MIKYYIVNSAVTIKGYKYLLSIEENNNNLKGSVIKWKPGGKQRPIKEVSCESLSHYVKDNLNLFTEINFKLYSKLLATLIQTNPNLFNGDKE